MKVNVMVVDDSNVARHLVTTILTTDKAINICATAGDGDTALKMLKTKRPDVIALDLNMPGLDGLEVTKRIMQTAPIPIIIVTSDKYCTANPFLLLEAGAVAVLPRPAPPGHPEHEQTSNQLIRTIKALSGVKLVRRVGDKSKTGDNASRIAPVHASKPRCIVIGASTGGPQVLKQIVSALPANFPIPIMITQHMATGFMDSLVGWLKDGSRIRVLMGADGQKLEPGCVYVAPDDRHMGISNKLVIDLSASDKEHGVRPAVSYMFRSVAQALDGDCVGILLSGMGRDGANELALIKTRGGLTIAQDEESSLIHGMPGVAIAAGATVEVLPPERIIARMLEIAGVQPFLPVGFERLHDTR
jgi:two-component system chemotaxis response regulator CheB